MALQPNDLMIGYRDLCSQTEVKKITKQKPQAFSVIAPNVEQNRLGHGMEKASRDIYVNYTEAMSRVMFAALTVPKVKGWEVFGLCSFDPALMSNISK